MIICKGGAKMVRGWENGQGGGGGGGWCIAELGLVNETNTSLREREYSSSFTFMHDSTYLLATK